MTENGGGKDLALTRYAIDKATKQERLSYAAILADLIARSPLPQHELADASGVTPRTIRNIVQGKVSPQADKLIALFLALGVDLDGSEDADVRTYTKLLAPVIRRIHPDYRTEAVSEAIGVLSDAALRNPFSPHGTPANVSQFRPRAVVATDHDLEEVAAESITWDPDDTDNHYDNA